jgi:hypothetical protein
MHAAQEVCYMEVEFSASSFASYFSSNSDYSDALHFAFL